MLLVLPLIIATVLGASTGVLFSFGWRLAHLAGYAGLDILYGIHKIFKAQRLIARGE
jgi:hypothetical protein